MKPRGEIKTIKLATIVANDFNPKDDWRASKKGIKSMEKLKASLKEHGQVVPLIVRAGVKKGEVELINGHHRFAALGELGATEAVVLDLGKLSKKDAVKIALSTEALRFELDEARVADLLHAEFDLLGGLDLTGLPYTNHDAARLAALAHLRLGGDGAGADDLPEPPPARAKPGDLWVLGEHRLLCGDALDPDSYARLVGERRVDLMLTDPPYDVDYSGGSLANGKRTLRLKIKNDNLGAGFFDFVKKFFEAALPRVAGDCYVFSSSYELGTIKAAFEQAGGRFSTFIIWQKVQFTFGRSNYHRQFEPMIYGWRDGAKNRRWNGGRKQGDVWECQRPIRSEEHPTMKPVALLERAVENSSNPGDFVLDPFGGSGSTLIACERLGRKALLIELEPHYCDVVVARWEKFTGKTATLEPGA